MAVKNWGYGICKNVGSDNRQNLRIIARTTKGNFIKKASEHFNNANWIRQRMAETGSIFEIELLSKYPENTLIQYDILTKEVTTILTKP